MAGDAYDSENPEWSRPPEGRIAAASSWDDVLAGRTPFLRRLGAAVEAHMTKRTGNVPPIRGRDGKIVGDGTVTDYTSGVPVVRPFVDPLRILPWQRTEAQRREAEAAVAWLSEAVHGPDPDAGANYIPL
ncbi:hypothetical protein P3T36_004857 [Kitasatospora sp. MAP12-15]|uniref:hypothetical protein n=1 Tax=unclassified Kitasatospora TaxID=2633591 RepID=UPI00247372CE|nr:hypothetical protein [Kitasatospora sp. MAP12-44]MDH6110211.1 hypothetical protein [Kitasatospora sp. MAP12-44]